MSLFVLLTLLTFAAIGLLIRKMRFAVSCTFIAIVLLLLAGNGYLPAYLLNRLQTPYPPHTPTLHWQPHSLIIMLGAGIARTPDDTTLPGIFAMGRILKTAELYRDCQLHVHDCRILLSGGDPRHIGQTEARVYQRSLLALGIPSRDILLEDASQNTWQNAQLSHALLRQQHDNTLILVTSAVHLSRAIVYFAAFGLHPQPISADWLEAKYSWLPLAYNLTLTAIALHEYIGIARFYVYQWLGWNK